MKRHATVLRAGLLGGATAAIVALIALMGPGAAAVQAIPLMTRSEIVSRAESALGLDYVWGKESWVPDAGSGSGTDCSGLALKCWEVPRTLLYQEEDYNGTVISPRYTSYEFYACAGPWYALTSRSQLVEGDVLAISDGTSGHVVIYVSGDAWNSPIVYEAPGTGQVIRRGTRYLSSGYLPRRRNSLLEGSTIVLDNPTAKSVGGTDIGGNWTRSTSVAGYYGDNFQVRQGTTADAWARWTPRFPASKYYDVYMRWTAASNRATAARVTVFGPYGPFSKSVNQRINGGSWNFIGRYYFTAGYRTGAGSVVIFATGADGYVVADAVKFVPAQ